jgi:hypothetical protein
VSALNRPLLAKGSAVRKAAKKVSVGFASLSIVVGAGLYLLAPTSEALAMTVSTHASATLGHKEVLYGSVVDYHGVAIHSAEMVFGTVDHGKREVFNTLYTHPSGAFRGVVAVGPGEYFVELIVHTSGHDFTKTRDLAIAFGHYYKVSGRVTISNVFAILPVTSY